jgi:hypothetical protein
LKNEKERSYRRISIFLFIINFFSILYLTYERNFTRWGPLILSIIAAFAVFASFYLKNRNEKMTFTGAFFLFILAWQTAGFWIPEILNFLFAILNLYASQTPIVSINENNITYPSLLKKKFSWQELSNLILKDGLLTIDLKNNRIIQQPIAETSSTVDEKEFNEFCKQQLNK